MKNDFTVNGDTVFIKLKRRNGPDCETKIDRKGLPLADNFPGAWCAIWNKDTKSFYAVGTAPRGSEGPKTVILARVILSAPSERQVDHIHHDTLDNRRSELRLATRRLNCLNPKGLRSTNTSGVPGVTWRERNRRWRVQFVVHYKQHNFGTYTNKAEAEQVAKQVRKALLIAERESQTATRA